MSEKPTYQELEQRVQELESVESQYKRMFEEQQQKNTRYQNLFENMLQEVHVWNLVYDDVGNIRTWKLVDANPAALKSWGKDLTKIVGKTADEIFPESNATELFMPIVRKIFTEGTPYIWESYFPYTGQHLHMISVPFGEYFFSTGFDITEHKRNEEDLIKQNYYFEKLQELGQIGTWELDLVNNQLLWTDENCRIFGVPEGTVVDYQTFIDKVHPDDREYVDMEWQAGVKGKPYDIEHRLLLDGEVRWVREKADLLFDDNGKAISAIGFTQDITDRKQAEMELEESEEKYRLLFENASQGIGYWTTDAKVISFNKIAAEDMQGSPNEFVGKSAIELFENEQGGVFTDRIKNVVKTNQQQNYEDTVVLASGEKTFLSSYDAVSNYSGEVLGVQIISTEITERIKAEIELERIKLAIDQSSDAIGMSTAEGQHFYQNSTFTKLFGYDLNEVAALHPTKLYQEPDLADKIFKTIMDGGTWTGPIVMVTKNGRNIPIELRANAIKDEHGKVAGLVGLHLDMTDRLKLEKQLLQAQKMESIGTLAGGIAHDFNNILSSIIGFTELALEAAPKGSAQRDDLEEVQIAGNRAKELVQQILAFARQSEEETKPVRLSDIVTEVLKLVRPSTPTNIVIKQIIDSTAKVMGNTSQLHQVVMNLCTNTIHSLQKTGGLLEIGLKNTLVANSSELKTLDLSGGEYVELTVTDNGPGIDPAIIDNIFEPYFTTKRVGEGTGMGLAMVKGIIETYGGDIRATSKPGKKTSFVIRLPIATGRRHTEEAQVASFASGTERILFVDDEPPIAKMGSRMLESLGYTVTMRTSSYEALELFREKQDDFDLVITDMTMPSMTGDELSVELRKIRPNIPIILCTGYSNKINDEGSKKIGINAFAYKPFTKSDFAKTIREVLDAC